MFFRILTLVNTALNIFLLYVSWKLLELIVQMGLSLDFYSAVLQEHVAGSVIPF